MRLQELDATQICALFGSSLALHVDCIENLIKAYINYFLKEFIKYIVQVEESFRNGAIGTI